MATDDSRSPLTDQEGLLQRVMKEVVTYLQGADLSWERGRGQDMRSAVV